MNDHDIAEKKTLSPNQRRRQLRKQIREKHARHQRVLNELNNPLASLTLLTGDVPEHLLCPTTMQGCRRLVFEQNALLHGFTEPFYAPPSAEATTEVFEPELPALLRKRSRVLVPDGSDVSSLVRLACGYALDPDELVSWHSQGRYRAAYYFDTHPDDPHPAGEWALIYEQELEWIMPSLSLKWNRRRSEYFVQILRNEGGEVFEMRVYSKLYKPILRLPLALPPEYQPPLHVLRWWTRKTHQ